jgi:hypothetical protein
MSLITVDTDGHMQHDMTVDWLLAYKCIKILSNDKCLYTWKHLWYTRG